MNTIPRLRVAFVLTRFTVGGAEMMLWKLVSRMDRARFDPQVIALADRPDGMFERFAALGVPCHVLGMHRGFGALPALVRLAVLLRRTKPDVVQGWLYHANLAATAAALLARVRAPVLWSIRGTLPSADERNRWSAAVIGLSGRLSSLPPRIVSNSLAAAVEHEARLNYPRETRVLIANGFDTASFQPSPDARSSLRSELGVAADTLLIGLCARYHAMKDHAGFLRAAASVNTALPDVHFVLAGDGADAANRDLAQCVAEHRLGARVHLLGRRDDMPRVTAALDVASSASAYGEGFSNAIGEAMSCAVPCAVTDVGDSAHIVADTGRVVPPRDPQALAQALCELARMGRDERQALGGRARERIVAQFSLDAIVRQYEGLYEEVHGQRLASSAASALRGTSPSRSQ